MEGASYYSMAVFLVFFISLFTSISRTNGYDALDPHGNITITWDFMLQNENEETYDVKVYIYNLQLFRNVEPPGWKLNWEWKGEEVIWNMRGAEASQQGDCSEYRGRQELPHCCLRKPAVVDLMPGAPFNLQVSNCCKAGVLSSMAQDPSSYASAFQMTIEMPAGGRFTMPENFSLGLPGYSCGSPFRVSPSKFSADGGRRWTQALETWNVTCIYSQFRASSSPKCCVSLSAFYNSTILPCPPCSCACQGLAGSTCVEADEAPPLLQLPHKNSSLVRCSHHMCPVRVHWHIKESYKEYWRVKMTITNLNILKNYSMWNLVVLHPNLQSLTQVFSFNYRPLIQYGDINDTGMFWGIRYYNDLLLAYGGDGNVQTEMLLHKDAGIFTFREGWAFPRKIIFNGDECVMPPPDQYPRLPNQAPTHAASTSFLSIFIVSLFLTINHINLAHM